MLLQYRTYDSDFSQLKVFIGDNESCYVVTKNEEEENLIYFENILKAQNLYFNSGNR
jgi:hypothetical protein